MSFWTSIADSYSNTDIGTPEAVDDKLKVKNDTTKYSCEKFH